MGTCSWIQRAAGIRSSKRMSLIRSISALRTIGLCACRVSRQGGQQIAKRWGCGTARISKQADCQTFGPFTEIKAMPYLSHRMLRSVLPILLVRTTEAVHYAQTMRAMLQTDWNWQ